MEESMEESMETIRLIEKLAAEHHLSGEEWVRVIDGREEKTEQVLFQLAREAREPWYGKQVFVRGLIEFTSFCRNDCYYCGLRRSNQKAERYRLTEEEILSACEAGYRFGFRTFVLQGGEDPYFTDERIVRIVRAIREGWPDCAITLSIGEREEESYRSFREAGADRYLLRHETADPQHYGKLHPAELSAEHRQNCLRTLKKLGYQTGAGFMVGSPYQTAEQLARDMLFLEELQPEMVGIGPFIPHHGTPFREEKAGSLALTCYMLGLTRLLLPSVLLPATTALGTIHPRGRELGMEAGANVVMPNLSPREVREKYLLYDHKLCTGTEAAESLDKLKESMRQIGYEVVTGRGDHASRAIRQEAADQRPL